MTMLINRIKAFFRRKDPSKFQGKRTGIIKFFNHRKGYGFIHSRQILKDVFVHIKDVNDRIYSGAKVEFEVENNTKGLIARNVELVDH